MIDLNVSTQFTDLEKEKFKSALALANQALSDLRFAALWCRESSTYNQGLTQAAILVRIQQPLSLKISRYTPMWPWSKAISYEAGGGVYFNSRKFGSMSVESLASNLLHEAAHGAGFTHPGNAKNAVTMATVPYRMNAVFETWVNSR